MDILLEEELLAFGRRLDQCTRRIERGYAEAAASDVRVIYLGIPADGGKMGPAAVYPELPGGQFIDLYRPRREPDFYLVHPPAAVLDEYAALLTEALRARGLLSRAKPTPHNPRGDPSASLEIQRYPELGS